MKAVLLLLSLIFLVPVLSYDDCQNCEVCVNNKCRRCSEGYALTKIYTRFLCIASCGGDQQKIWDPVLATYACDKTVTCGASSNCAECLRSQSCKRCSDNFALRLRSTGQYGFNNECDGTCQTCVEPQSGALVCNTTGASCEASETATKEAPTASAAASTNPTSETDNNGAEGSTSTTASAEPGTHAADMDAADTDPADDDY